MKFDTFSRDETFNIGKKLAENARPGQIFALTGDLGAGKTVLTQGFARGLGITEPVTSPTFTIREDYTQGRMPLYHFDVYRIEEPEEMEEIGYEDCFYGEGVCLVEWAQLIEEIMPEDTVWITIRRVAEKGENYRSIEITNGGDL